MNIRRLSSLIQEVLPAEFNPILFTANAETKEETLSLTIKNRLEYGVLHEMTKDFLSKSSMAGYDRMTECYTIKLVNLSKLKALLQANKERCKAKLKKLFSDMLSREFNAFLQRNKPLLNAHIHAELTESLAAADTVAKLVYLHQLMPKLAADITQSATITPFTMQFLYGPSLLPAANLRPLAIYVANLESSQGCCSLFFPRNYSQIEYDTVSNLLVRLKKPLVGQTVKRLVDAVRVKLDLADTIFCADLQYLLNDLDGSSLTNGSRERGPLLPNKHFRPATI
jgi:hypothetical protein